MFERRQYESRAVRELLDRLASHQRVLAVGPTGCGKTVIASMLVKQSRYQRVLFVAHRYELIDQAHGTLNRAGI